MRKNKTYKQKPTRYWQKKKKEYLQLFLIALTLSIVFGSIYEATQANLRAKRCETTQHTKTEEKDCHELPVAKDEEIEQEQEKEEVRIIELRTPRPEIETMIYNIADEMDRFEWGEYLVKLAFCESSLNPDAINRVGNNPADSYDRGLFQYNSYWQSHITDECAYDIRCATENTIRMIEAGKQHRWVCDSKVKGVPIHLVINK